MQFLRPVVAGSGGGAGVSDHGDLTGLIDDDHTQYYNAARLATALAAFDHGGFAGLADDDHTQYLLADGTRALSGDLTFSGSAPTIAASASNQSLTIKGNRDAGDTGGADVILGSTATRTGSTKLLSVQNNGSEVTAIDRSGNITAGANGRFAAASGQMDLGVGANVFMRLASQSADFLGTGDLRVSNAAGRLRLDNGNQTTVGAAGGASELPATPTGYQKFKIGTTEYVFPYYAVS
jgi:hypothetical protein